jgi:hypothetical protein
MLSAVVSVVEETICINFWSPPGGPMLGREGPADLGFEMLLLVMMLSD